MKINNEIGSIYTTATKVSWDNKVHDHGDRVTVTMTITMKLVIVMKVVIVILMTVINMMVMKVKIKNDDIFDNKLCSMKTLVLDDDDEDDDNSDGNGNQWRNW